MKKYCPKCGKPYIMGHTCVRHDASGEMLWVAIEDSDTREVTDFVHATEKQVLDLMEGHRADKHDVTKICVQDVEDGHNVVYDGVSYKGGFGYNILVAQKYLEL